MLWLHKTCNAKVGKFGTRTALTVVMSNEDKCQCFLFFFLYWAGIAGWLPLISFASRWLSLGEGDVEESGEILNILLQPYTRDGDSLGMWGGRRPCVVKSCRSWDHCEDTNTVSVGIHLESILNEIVITVHQSRWQYCNYCFCCCV